MDVVFRDDAPARQRQRLALDGEDAIDEHERLVGQPDARRKRIDLGERGAEDARDGADSELHALRAVERDGGCGVAFEDRGEEMRLSRERVGEGAAQGVAEGEVRGVGRAPRLDDFGGAGDLGGERRAGSVSDGFASQKR